MIHSKIDKNFLVFVLNTQSSSLAWINLLPLPLAVCSKNYEIITTNQEFKQLIGECPNNILNYAQQFDAKLFSTLGQEILWNSNLGILPMLTWIKEYETNKLVILENRTEFIKLKTQAQEAQHLQILGQFTSGIIHDFNNLLTAISGFTEMLESSIINQNDSTSEMLSEIKRNTNLAANLAKELLNFVKQKSEKNCNTNLCVFLSARKNMLQKLLGEKIKLEIQAEHQGFVELSESQLEQIILNMAINSKDAMENEGNLTIKVKKIDTTESVTINKYAILEKGSYFILEITDTGKGILKENIDKIFSPFFSTKNNGTGLGLTSCMRIIQHINGAITLKTAESGTQFSIYLPIVNRKEIVQNQSNEIQNKMQCQSKTLVLAEDDEGIRTLVSKALMQIGYTVHAFSNALDALEVIKNEKIDCLITDAILPGMDGTAFAKIAKEINPKLPILIVSGYSFEDLEKNLPPEVHYLAKPFTLKTLKDKINNLLIE